MSIIRTLKAQIKRYPSSRAHLCRNAGISRPVVTNFMNGKRGLSLASADKLAKVLRLQLTHKESPNGR